MTTESWVIIIGEAVIALFFIAAYCWSNALYEVERKVNRELEEEIQTIRHLNPGLIEELDQCREELKEKEVECSYLNNLLNRINQISEEGWTDDEVTDD